MLFRSVLDSKDMLSDRYHLVVSSPGIDRPLKLQRQYNKHIGRNFTLKITSGSSAEQLQGTLTSVAGDDLLFQLTDDSVKKIDFKTITEAYVKTAW